MTFIVINLAEHNNKADGVFFLLWIGNGGRGMQRGLSTQSSSLRSLQGWNLINSPMFFSGTGTGIPQNAKTSLINNFLEILISEDYTTNGKVAKRQTDKNKKWTQDNKTELLYFITGSTRGRDQKLAGLATRDQSGEECWKVVYKIEELSSSEQRLSETYILRETGADCWAWLQWSRAGMWLVEEWVSDQAVFRVKRRNWLWSGGYSINVAKNIQTKV